MSLPNILWICTDQQRYDTIGALGNPQIDTPNLDRLCREGVAFNRTYCQSPICTPSRASFLTGLYPSSIHVNRNGNDYFPDAARLITRELADLSYTCGLVGKLHIAAAWSGTERRTDDGYGYFEYSHAPFQRVPDGNRYLEWILRQGLELDDILHKQESGEYYGYREDVPVSLHQSVWCADRAIEFIERPHAGPWLLSVNLFDPHPPFDAPQAYKRKYLQRPLPEPLFDGNDLETHRILEGVLHQTKDPKKPDEETRDIIASYYGMIDLIDEQIGRIVAALERTDQKRDTLIVFMSDHGEMLGDHGLLRKGCRFYEGAVRVPLIFSWPGRFAEGVVCEELTELTDVAPTLAELAGIRLERTHGRSLLPILENKASAPHRRFVRCEFYDCINPTLNIYAADRPAAHTPSYATMYFDGRHKLIVYHGLDYGELYDLRDDPGEFHNLWERPDMAELKLALLKRSFDESILITDPGAPQVGNY